MNLVGAAALMLAIGFLAGAWAAYRYPVVEGLIQSAEHFLIKALQRYRIRRSSRS